MICIFCSFTNVNLPYSMLLIVFLGHLGQRSSRYGQRRFGWSVHEFVYDILDKIGPVLQRQNGNYYTAS